MIEIISSLGIIAAISSVFSLLVAIISTIRQLISMSQDITAKKSEKSVDIVVTDASGNTVSIKADPEKAKLLLNSLQEAISKVEESKP